MVQLSAPSPDLIPVKQGKSSEKAPGPSKNIDGFKKAFHKEKESRETKGTGESAKKKVAVKSVRSESKGTDALKKTALKGLHKTTPSAGSEIKLAFLTKKAEATATSDLGISHKNAQLKAQTKNKVTDASSSDQIKIHSVPVHPDISDIKAELKKELSAHETEALLVPVKDHKNGKDETALSTAPIVLNASAPAVLPQQSQEIQVKSSHHQKDKKKNGDSEVKIIVEDRRTAHIKENSSQLLKAVDTGEPANKVTLELVPSDDVSGMQIRGEHSDTGGKSFVLQTAEEQKGAALLDRQLQDKGTQELTKNIRFVLKDHNEGEIKLILKPESLGKVRINLNMHENHIVGKIIVENNNVRQAFMNNLTNLTKALEDSGFSSASLDVSVGGDQTQGRRQYQDDRPVYFNDTALNSLDDQIPVVYEQGGSLSQINMMV